MNLRHSNHATQSLLILLFTPLLAFAQKTLERSTVFNTKRVKAYWEKGQYVSAINHLEPLAATQKHSPEFCYLYGKSLFLAGQKGKAREWLQIAYQQN
ncbi:MAG: hypothetical protein RML72_12815, partial [Bacteroidia bacterium]|nr:hypothetical protein [Bacteroidia bacterium]